MIRYEVRVGIDENECWYLDGKLHCEHGPAVRHHNWGELWYLNGVEYSRATWEEVMARRKSPPTPSFSGKIVEVDGKKYKLQEC